MAEMIKLDEQMRKMSYEDEERMKRMRKGYNAKKFHFHSLLDFHIEEYIYII